MKKKILRTVLSGILSLFLAIVFLSGSLCFLVNNTLCQPSFLTNIAITCGFTQELYEEITYNWENLLSITGVTDPDSIMAVLTPESVHNDAISYLENAYDGSSVLETAELKAQLETKIRDYAYSNNIYATPKAELEENITDLVNACMDAYNSSVKIRLLPKILGTVGRLSSYLEVCMWITVAGSVVVLVFLFLLQRKRREVLYFAAISTATNAGLLLTLVGCTWHYDVANRLPFEASALKTLVTTYLLRFIDKLQFAGFAFLVITIAFLAIYITICLLRRRKILC